MYELGLGVLQDYAEAAKWYRLGAEQGDSRSQNSLGTSYLTGEGVPEDYVESTKWYRRAAEQGHNKAQYNLGLQYNMGWGVLQSYVSAHMWLNIASVNGQPNGGKMRDAIAAQMTTADIAESQRRARVCLESDYQNCD